MSGGKDTLEPHLMEVWGSGLILWEEGDLAMAGGLTPTTTKTSQPNPFASSAPKSISHLLS